MECDASITQVASLQLPDTQVELPHTYPTLVKSHVKPLGWCRQDFWQSSVLMMAFAGVFMFTSSQLGLVDGSQTTAFHTPATQRALLQK
jgi:hypothetical protein